MVEEEPRGDQVPGVRVRVYVICLARVRVGSMPGQG